jgi:hypothetical protein
MLLLFRQSMNYYPESGKGKSNMGLYSKYVLPHLIDLSMKDRATTNCRSVIIPKATGRNAHIALTIVISLKLDFL